MSERVSVWRAEDVGHSHPALVGSVSCDVAVVGAGITGLTSALLMQRRGLQTVVVEARSVASGTTGGTTGKVTSQHRLVYADMIDRHGEEAARAYADANQMGVEMVRDLVGRLPFDCGFVSAPAVVYAADDDDADKLRREHEAASRLGLPSRLGEAAELPFRVPLALEFGDQGHVHPVRYCHALAEALVLAGGRIYEGSRVHDLDESANEVRLGTAEGEVTASQAILATLLPFVDRGGFFAKTRPWRAYGLAARLASPAPKGMYISASDPVRSFRPWPDGGENGVIIVGESHETGHEEATPGRWGELERWARESLGADSFEYRWSEQDYETADGIPYVGRSPLTKRTHVATGFAKWGLSNGTAAAAMLADLVSGDGPGDLGVFDAGRIGDSKAVMKLVADNAHVAAHFVGDRLSRLAAPSLDSLAPGDAGIVEVEGRSVAAFRDPAGELHMLDSNCTHLGCKVAWNDAEDTWDCPCHGSRFGIEGNVLGGPATSPLTQIRLESVG